MTRVTLCVPHQDVPRVSEAQRGAIAPEGLRASEGALSQIRGGGTGGGAGAVTPPGLDMGWGWNAPQPPPHGALSCYMSSQHIV